MRNVNERVNWCNDYLEKGFILTMRNVNASNLGISEELKESFILTMRNVNMETLAGGVFGSSEFYINYEECKF